MLVSDYFTKLSYGPLSNLSLSGEGAGTIVEAQQNKIIGYLNDGLQRIYTRFTLREREVLIEQHAHITFYHLDKRYAKENLVRPPENIPYILDLPDEPFEDDVLRVLSVVDEFSMERLNITEDNVCKVFTPFPNIIQVPFPEQDRPLSVVYQANHRRLEFGVTNAEIFLPAVLEPALVSLVAAQVYSSMNTQESNAKGREHMNDYELLVQGLESKGTTGIEVPPHLQTFEQRGFC
jgi:hypothetical protein